MQKTDHMEAALTNLAAYDNAPGMVNADDRLKLAGIHAQLAQAEQLKRIGDLMDGTTDAPGLIGITGHVTTGAP